MKRPASSLPGLPTGAAAHSEAAVCAEPAGLRQAGRLTARAARLAARLARLHLAARLPAGRL